MKTYTFAKRNFKEIIRDPLSIIFGIGLPVFLLIIFAQIKFPPEVTTYNIDNFAPAIVIFSFTFITLFSSSLIAKDRSSSFLTRLFSSPMKASNFILGYTISMIPAIIIQSVLFFIIALLFGLTFNKYILYTILVLIPISLIFIGLGLLIGCISSDKSAPGISSIVIQVVAFTSGMWFDTSMIGNVFATICNILPFKYCVDLTKSILHGNFDNLLLPVAFIVISIIIIYTITIILFKRKMNGDIK